MGNNLSFRESAMVGWKSRREFDVNRTTLWSSIFLMWVVLDAATSSSTTSGKWMYTVMEMSHPLQHRDGIDPFDGFSHFISNSIVFI